MAEAPSTFKDEKTEQATPKKRQKQRSEGNVFMSQELAMTIVIFLGAWILKIFGPWIFEHLYSMMIRYFNEASWQRINNDNLTAFLTGVLMDMAMLLTPVMFFLVLASAFSTLIQTGWLVTWKKMNWEFSKIFDLHWKEMNPVNMKKLVELGINILKIVFLGYALYLAYKQTVDQWIPYMDGPVINTFIFMNHLAFDLTMKICVVLFLVSILDWLYKRHEYEENMKMTKWEVRDEAKSGDIDPKVKGILRKRRYDLFRKIMMESVPKADVIITNPTHFAVAVQYNPEAMEAPKVVAKGVGPLAQKIKDLGRQHGIPLVENKPLAQILFKSVEVGSYIPVTLYKAVAEVLAYVYKLKGKKAA